MASGKNSPEDQAVDNRMASSVEIRDKDWRQHGKASSEAVLGHWRPDWDTQSYCTCDVDRTAEAQANLAHLIALVTTTRQTRYEWTVCQWTALLRANLLGQTLVVRRNCNHSAWIAYHAE